MEADFDPYPFGSVEIRCSASILSSGSINNFLRLMVFSILIVQKVIGSLMAHLAHLQVGPRLMVYGYGRRDSPRMQAALSAAIQAAAVAAPDTAAASINALVATEIALEAAAKVGFVALEESPPLLVSVLAGGGTTAAGGWAAITAAACGLQAIVERAQVSALHRMTVPDHSWTFGRGQTWSQCLPVFRQIRNH